MPDYTVKLKAICTQTIKVKAENEEEAVEKAGEGSGEIETDFEWYDVYKEDEWELTLTN